MADTNVPVQISTSGGTSQSWFGVNKDGNYGLLMGYLNGGSIGDGGVGAYIRNITEDPLYFMVSNSDLAMTILANKNVGIGTTSPASKLHVEGAGEQWVSVYTTDITGAGALNGIRTQSSTSGRQNTLFRNTANNLVTLRAGTDDGEINFIAGGSAAERIRILANGNVGIGTTSPITKLHVSNTAVINDAYGLALVENTSTGSGSAANSALNIKSKYGTSQFMQWENQGLRIGSRILDNSSVGDVYFTAGADSVKMVIQAGGQVRIGTTNSGSKLNVGGTIAAATNDLSNGMIVPRSLGLSHAGNSGTFTRTFNPVTLFGMGFRGGQVLFECTGWSQRVNCGYIQFQNAGGAGVITSVMYVQTAVQGNGSISVSVNSANDNSIDINFSNWHTNSHGFMCRITTNYM